MALVRYDIVPQSMGWLLSDSRSPPVAYLSSLEAIEAAKRKALADPDPFEIYVWKDGVADKVLSNASLRTLFG